MKNKSEINLALAFKALSNTNRLKVFEIIRNGYRSIPQCVDSCRPNGIPDNAVCVCEILERLNITAPTLSHHLKELRNAGLVDVYHRGQWSYYSIKEDSLETILHYFKTGSVRNAGTRKSRR